ncbi:MAG: cytochrome c [Maritimibacter sp.]|nr:cytochrome c [Maritimibacter sp.]
MNRKIWACAVAAVVAVPALAEFTQERAGYAPGVTDPVDSVLARRVAMAAANRWNDQTHDILDGAIDLGLDKARQNLDAISTVLLTLPEMFPEGSYVYSEEMAESDPAAVTLATTAVWENWDDFYSRALAAADVAYRAGRAAGHEEVLALTEELEGMCISCHDAYRRPQVTLDPEMLGLGPTD